LILADMAKEQVTYHRIFDSEIFKGELSLHKYPWHFHEAYTIVMVDEGAMRYVFRNGAITVNSGQVFVVNPFAAHYNSAADNHNCKYRVMFLPLWLFNQSPQQTGVAHFENAVNADVYNELSGLFENLKDVTGEEGYFATINDIAMLLHSAFIIKTASLASTERIEPALQFIHRHLDEKLTVAQLAYECNLSHFHFQRTFKKAIGLTVTAYIQQCRMERGRELLRKGLKPVFTSLESGFFDQSHFYKQFKKMWVLTPANLNK